MGIDFNNTINAPQTTKKFNPQLTVRVLTPKNIQFLLTLGLKLKNKNGS